MSIFSSYSQGENRVTSSILAVLRLLSMPAFDYLVCRLVDEENSLHIVRNQPSGGGTGIPDGEISANYNILIETKTVAANNLGQDDIDQLKRHLKRLKVAENGTQALLYLTPHDSAPNIVGVINDSRLVWKSFEDFDTLVGNLLLHENIKLSEIERFMLEQLHLMIEDEGLLPSRDNVVVVGARTAWPMYQRHKVYICQPNRAFRNVEYIAFYTLGNIKPKVAKISQRHREVSLEQINSDDNVLQINKTLKDKVNSYAEEHIMSGPKAKEFFEGAFQVFELDDSSEVDLGRDITNDITAINGRNFAYTVGQRYTSLDKLKEAQTTSDLSS